MSERDLQRMEVLAKIVECGMKVITAAHVLELSPRQVRRLLARFTKDGAAAIATEIGEANSVVKSYYRSARRALTTTNHFAGEDCHP